MTAKLRITGLSNRLMTNEREHVAIRVWPAESQEGDEIFEGTLRATESVPIDVVVEWRGSNMQVQLGLKAPDNSFYPYLHNKDQGGGSPSWNPRYEEVRGTAVFQNGVEGHAAKWHLDWST